MPSNLSFNFDQLISFVTVAEKGTITKAANSLGKDRSTIHQHISNLEIDLNLQLFHRHGKSTTLTQSGELILPKARHLIYSAQHMQGFSSSLGKEESDKLTVCCDDSVPGSLIAEAHQALSSDYPFAKINWLHRSSSEIFHALEQDQADLGITMVPGKTLMPNSGIDFINLGFLKMGVYVGSESRLSQIPMCSLTELARNIEYVPEGYLSINMFKTSEFSMNRTTVGRPDVLYALLKHTDGWAMLPEHSVKNSPYASELTQIKTDFTSDLRWSYAVYSKNLSAGAVRKTLVRHLKQCFADATQR